MKNLVVVLLAVTHGLLASYIFTHPLTLVFSQDGLKELGQLVENIEYDQTGFMLFIVLPIMVIVMLYSVVFMFLPSVVTIALNFLVSKNLNISTYSKEPFEMLSHASVFLVFAFLSLFLNIFTTDTPAILSYFLSFLSSLLASQFPLKTKWKPRSK